MALKPLWDRLRPGDRWLLGALLLLCLGLLAWLTPGTRGRRVVAERDGQVIFVAPLDQPRRFALEGPLGKTELEIKGGAVRVLSSPCPRKICIGMGAIDRAGELLACVPNHLVIRVEGEAASGPKDYDLLSR